MIALLLGVVLSIAPWTGAGIPTSTAGAATYRLQIAGVPQTVVHLKATGVADGWLAAFCTPKYCSPQRVEIELPSSGHAAIQFELVRESDSSPKTSGATISSTDGVSVTVPAAIR
jgi:hypothetical protein